MAARTIEHPLRTITLVYSDQMAETAADSVLLQRYTELHDVIHAHRKQYAKLRYEYLEQTDAMAQVAASVEQIELGIGDLMNECDVLLTKVKRADAILELTERLNAYTETVHAFHNDILTPFTDAMTALNEPWNAFLEAEDALDDFYVAYENEVIKPFQQDEGGYALDINSYDDDLEELKDYFITQAQFLDITDVTDGYENLVNRVNAAYTLWTKGQEGISRFFADDTLLDHSLSEACANDEVPKADRPLYLMDPKDSMVQNFVASYGLMADRANTSLVIGISPDVVQEKQVFMVQEIVLALQHFPRMLEKLLYSIDFAFKTEYGSDMEAEDWKGQEMYVRWFHGFSTMPAVYFFLADHDARSYFLMGDMLYDGKVQLEGEHRVRVEGEALDELANRVFHIGHFFMLFCHNTGFDPTPPIQRLLDEMQLPITIEAIREEYEDSIAKGIVLQVKGVKN